MCSISFWHYSEKFELTFYFPGSRFRSWHLTHCSSTCLFIRITSSLSSKWSSSTCLLSLYLFIRITSHHNDPHQLACYPSCILFVHQNDPHQLTCYPCTCSLPTISWLCQPLKHLALNLCPDLLRHRIFLYIKSLCRDLRHKVFIVVVFDIKFSLLWFFYIQFFVVVIFDITRVSPKKFRLWFGAVDWKTFPFVELGFNRDLKVVWHKIVPIFWATCIEEACTLFVIQKVKCWDDLVKTKMILL